MTHADTDSQSADVRVTPPEADPEIDSFTVRHEHRNLVVLAIHQILLRVAWVFKTESVIIPAFMDHIAGPGWLRGCLPVLNRVGQSVPQVYLADKLAKAGLKRHALTTTTGLMAVPFFVLVTVLLLTGNDHPIWLPAFYLFLYTFFFCVNGINVVSFGTVQGKLIRADRRGRLMAIAGVGGSVGAIAAAWYLMRDWLQRADGGYPLIFSLTGIGFTLAAVVTLLVVEVNQPVATRQPTGRAGIRRILRLLRSDIRLRRLSVVAMLFVSTQLLFPHYQALGRVHASWDHGRLMHWVIAQNAGAGLYGLLAGSLADRFGNRAALRLLLTGVALTPILALVLANGERYWITFAVLGAVPVTFRTLTNYALELCEPDQHPVYISALRLSMALPLLLSPLIGLWIDATSFSPAFLTIAGVTGTGAILTFFMDEPRTAKCT